MLLHQETADDQPTAAQRYQATLQEFPEALKGIGKLPQEYRIHLQQGVKLPVPAARRVPSALEKTVKDDL